MVTIQVGSCALTGNWNTQRTRLRHFNVGSKIPSAEPGKKTLTKWWVASG